MPTHTHTPTGFHKIVIAALCIFALPGCTMITGRLDSEFLNDRRDEYRQLAGGEHCPLHEDQRLETFGFDGDVRVSMVLPPSGFHEARNKEFRFAKPYGTESLGGTITDLILYCPECEKANQAWLRSHEDE